MSEKFDRPLRHTVSTVRDVLYRISLGHDREPNVDLRAHFAGCCGLAQCLTGYALQDAGFHVHPIATQSLDGWQQGHAALSMCITINNEKKWLLIDPTFCQFFEEDDPKDILTPSGFLERTAEGRELAEALLQDGFAEITLDNAVLYLAAFTGGNAGLDNQQSYAFITAPPSHPYHFRRDEGCDQFSRENLAKRGWLIPSVAR